MSTKDTITFDDFRGGMSERDPAFLAANQVAEAYNLTYWNSRLGARRNGISSLVTPAAVTTSMHPYVPDSTEANERLIVSESSAWAFYTPAYARTAITPSPADIFDAIIAPTSAANLGGKLFITCSSTTSVGGVNNRLHVWDGTTFRRVGLDISTTSAPTAADSGGVGTLSGTRYYRVRFVMLSGSTVLVRSEPSPVLTHAPGGANASVTVSRPSAAGTDTHLTHWELEESIDNANFYRIATTINATTTYVDSTAFSAVATTGVLSAVSGEYTPPGSARFVAVDRDRLVMAGNFTDASKDSEVSWTVVGTDTTGVGNDERVPTATGNRVNCDGRESGPITALVAFDSEIVVFKARRTYLLTHTQQRVNAYKVRRISKVFGALRGSVEEGVDAAGNPALYFYDPRLGPMMYGTSGFTQLAPHMQRTLLAAVDQDPQYRVAFGEFYPDKMEMWWYLKGQASAGLDPDWPMFRLCYNAETGGLNLHTLPKSVYASTIWQGYPIASTRNSSDNPALGRCDDPAATTDLGSNFRAYTLTAALEPKMKERIGCRGAVLRALPLSGVSLSIRPVKDYNRDTSPATATALLTATASERYVVVPVNELAANACAALQFEIGDASARAVLSWSADRLAVSLIPGGSS